MVNIEEEINNAKTYKEAGQVDRAIDLLQSLLDQTSDDWRIWTEKGHCLVRKGDYADALASFERAIELEPERPSLWNNKGYTLKEIGDLAGAITATRRAKFLAKTKRDKKTANYNLGCYLSLSGKSEQALDHLSKACAADSQIKEWAKQDSDLDPIRSHPRFSEIMERPSSDSSP